MYKYFPHLSRKRGKFTITSGNTSIFVKREKKISVGCLEATNYFICIFSLDSKQESGPEGRCYYLQHACEKADPWEESDDFTGHH